MAYRRRPQPGAPPARGVEVNGLVGEAEARRRSDMTARTVIRQP